MDDFVLSNLQESRNEWCSRLISIFTPLVAEGIKSIFGESWKMCIDNDEASKYLMTFQNLLSRVPKWNSVIVEEERKRIIERSGCNYLEDLITCVHIIQLKVLTSIRVGNKQKKIDISIPKLDHFIHKVYIHVARKVYMNVYLFEKNINPLQMQKNNRELEMIIQECILTSIRESIPTEAIIRAYMDESIEQDEEVIIENLDEPTSETPATPVAEQPSSEDTNGPITSDTIPEEYEKPALVPSIQNLDNEPVITRLSFNDYDSVLDTDTNNVETVNAPKTIERLEEISTSRALQRKLEEEEEDENERIHIHTEPIDLSGFEVLGDEDTIKISTEDPIIDFEEL
uniref:Uncharacterized protein n=1 Tax=viral metagenome TaxID=1070528 RepID=A0A6C0D4N3_9ZZZZ